MTLYGPLRPHVTSRTIILREGESKNYYDKTHFAYLRQLKQALYYGNYACFNLLFELGLSCATLWYGGHLYYPTRPDQPVLTNLNLTFPQGKVTALVGSSGGGKSSIVSLLCRSGIQEQCLKAVDVAVNTLGIPGKGSMIVLAERF